ncbi:MAG: peptide deformylase [Rickettsiales bacterium]|jgi:peptide deformylase|nr:peptide deformylase [Rickettsiales bacterium]
MAVLPIITAPDKRLKVKSDPIAFVDADIATLMEDMLETMYLAPGVGLAAPQVGITKRIIVVDVSKTEEERKPFCMANPELVWASKKVTVYEEGCLSLPEHYANVERPECIRVKYIDETNNERVLEAQGLLATCIQHEIDHLDGVLFVDHLTSLKRNMIIRKLQKTKKMKAAAE